MPSPRRAGRTVAAALALGARCAAAAAAAGGGAASRNVSQDAGPLLAALPKGQYPVKLDYVYNVPGLKNGGPYTAVIVYPYVSGNPDPAGSFPVVSFAHGTGGGATTGTGYKTDLETVASYGFIVVATESCPTVECGAAFSYDQLALLAVCASMGTQLHPALYWADFSRAGVYGHSMGAMATVRSAQGVGGGAAPYNVKAAVAQHTCIDPTNMDASLVAVPILYTSGGKDTICPYSYSTYLYNLTPRRPRVLVSWADATHFEPVDTEGRLREVVPSALFLACHIRGEHCDVAGDAFCKQALGQSLCYYNTDAA